jgi:multicomponent Na+:H+ antiporter subunit D
MTEFLTVVPPAFVVLAAALAVALLPRLPGHAIGALSTLWILAVALFAPDGNFWEINFLGFETVFLQIDGLSQLVALAAGILATAAVVYAYSSDAPKLMTALALSYVGSTAGVIFAGDWVSLIAWWEFMAVTSTLLVWHHGGEAVRAGYRYALAHGIGGSLFLFAIVWHLAVGGGLLIDGGIGVGGAAPLAAIGIEADMPMILAAAGIGINCGFIGLHTWLPDTYPRPHIAASVFLSVFTTKTGAYVLLQTFPDGSILLAYMGGAMAVYGAAFALFQHDMRALLSYHIMAQLGYMIAGIGLLTVTKKGGVGAIMHAFNNILFKALLFMAVGVVIYRTGIEDLYDLGGLWREMPLTAIAYLLGALSITATPPFNGFVSKGAVLTASHEYHAFGTSPVWILLLVGAVGTLLSFIKLGYYAFLHGTYDGSVRDAKWGQTAAMFAVGGACLAFGLPGGWEFAVGLVAPEVAGFHVHDLHPYSTGHLTESAALILVSVPAFVLIRKPLSKLGHVPDFDVIVNPLVYYTGKAGIYGTTELFAAVDRAAVRFVETCYWISAHPVRAVERGTRWLPDGIRPEFVGESTPDGGGVSRLYLRAGIGTTVLVLSAAVTVLLALSL